MMESLTREDWKDMDPVEFRARIRERVHHTVEILLYRALHEAKPLAPSVGSYVNEMLAVWEERGLPADTPDIAWTRRLLKMAEDVQAGRKVDLTEFATRRFSQQDLETADRLIKERRSVRHWTEEEVPDWMIDKIIEAGLWGAHACNLQSLRFIVVREKNEPGLFVGADIPGGPVHIVACQDFRAYRANTRMTEKNRLLDCGAAMQNMVLQAHALGLGGCWLTFRQPMIVRLRERFNLHEELQVQTYMDVGFPAQTPMPPARMTLNEAVIARL